MSAKKKLIVDKTERARPTLIGPLAQQQTAVLVSILGARLSRGATAYYRNTWKIGTVEWRLLMTFGSIASLNVSELSEAADVDKAAASRGLVLLQENELVSVRTTRTRGRAAIASLTVKGKRLSTQLAQVSRQREARLFQNFTATEKNSLDTLLLRLAEAIDTDDWKY